jgi:NADH-quinone oxidoreductase subunit E
LGDDRVAGGQTAQGERRVTSLPHLFETALLLTVSYVVGCLLGFGCRRFAQFAQGAFVPGTAVDAPAGSAAALPMIAPSAPLLALPPPIELAVPPLEPQPQVLRAPNEPEASVEPPMARMDEALLAVQRHGATVIALPRRDAPLDAGDIADIGRPPGLEAPRGGSPDDLQRIKGIGPRLATSLNALGIFHFDQIAAWNEINLAWIEAQPHLRGRAVRDRWIEQAAALSGVVLTGRRTGQPDRATPASASVRST